MQTIFGLFVLSLIFSFESYAEGPKLIGKGGLVDKSMNPAISVNGLFLGQYGTAVENNRGFRIQEIEAQFTAAVDPYFFTNVVFTSEGGTAVVPEEAWLSTLSLPVVTLKAGLFWANFGKNNLLHTHTQPMIDKPLVNKTLFGEGGLKSPGVEADILLPLPWYSDLILAGIGGQSAIAFQANGSENLAGVSRWENLFDLSDQTTLGLGFNYALGENQAKQKSHFLGADLTIKFVTEKGRGEFAIVWTTEYIRVKRHGMTGAPTPGYEDGNGLYSTLMTRIQPRFWIGGRFDLVNLSNGADVRNTGENLVLAFVPSEFSTLRLQSGLTQAKNVDGSKWQTLLQLNVTIGSHPAHAY